MILLVTGLSVILTSCSTPQEEMAAQGYWIGDRVQGPPKISIDLTRQVVKYYKGGTLVGAAPISSGREGHGTVRGQYSIIEKDVNHRSSLYGSFVTSDGRIVQGDVDARRDSPPPGTHFLGASMRSFMRITGGIGMHEGYLPGFAASHGCIRLPSRMAAIFYAATPHGTPVEILGETPKGHLTTWLPVPHKLRPEDIVVARKQEEDTRPKAKVAIAEPAPPPAPKPKPVVAPIVAKVEPKVATEPVGTTKYLASKPAITKAPETKVVAVAPAKEVRSPSSKSQPTSAEKPAPQVAAASTPSFWSRLSGKDKRVATAPVASKSRPQPTQVVTPTPAHPKVIAAAPAPVALPPKKAAPVIAMAKAEEPQKVTYQPLSSLNKKASSWGFGSRTASTPAPKATKKAPAVRGQTYFLPGVN